MVDFYQDLCFPLLVTKFEVVDTFGSVGAVAKAVGVTSQAVSQWPDVLPPRIEDRVVAALTRAGQCLPANGGRPAGHRDGDEGITRSTLP